MECPSEDVCREVVIVEKDLLSKKALSEKLVFYYFDYIEAFFKNQ